MTEDSGHLTFTSPQSPEAQAWLDKVKLIITPELLAATDRDIRQFMEQGFVIIPYPATAPHELVCTPKRPDPIHNAIRKTRDNG